MAKADSSASPNKPDGPPGNPHPTDSTRPPLEFLELPDHKKSSRRWLDGACILLVILAALHASDKNIGGGDTWVAMACGRYTLGPWAQKLPEGRTAQMKLLDAFGIHLTQHDPFSAASRNYNPQSGKFSNIVKRVIHEFREALGHKNLPPLPKEITDEGWVNQNWLTHVLFYKLYTVCGGNSIVAYKFVQAILTALLAYWAARVLGAHPALAAAAASFGILLSRSYIDLRPNVSSIFFAAIMILLLAWWRNKRYWALAGMIPVTIIWANVHGGFIYAIMVFSLVVAAHLLQKLLCSLWQTGFIEFSWRGFAILVGAAVAVTLIPGIFSPFGWQNLAHPLVVAAGEEGKIWRSVIEWWPIFKKGTFTLAEGGFGNAVPYLWFLAIFALVFVAWWVVFFFRPRGPEDRRRRHRKAAAHVPWPRLDLAQFAVMAITIYMAWQSRRFIFLAGIVLAPYLASMSQELIDMLRLKWGYSREHSLELKPLGPRPTRILLVLTLVACLALAAIFAACMWDKYYAPPYDGQNFSVFERMVGIPAQPVDAMNFFHENPIRGVVFNEWTHGGFVAFHQTPDPETGQPPCKVYMDGRAQAAYRVQHFQKWQRNRSVVSSRQSGFEKAQDQLEQQAKILGLPRTDPDLYDALVQRIPTNPELYQPLATVALSNPALYDSLLEREGINVAVLSVARQEQSHEIFNLLLQSRNWLLVYFDEKYAVLVRRDEPRNQPFLDLVSGNAVHYPDPFIRDYLLARQKCGFDNPRLQQEGWETLMSLNPPSFLQSLNRIIFNVGLSLRKDDQLEIFFSRLRDDARQAVESGQRFDRINQFQALVQSTAFLKELAQRQKNFQKSREYQEQLDHYRKRQKEFMENVVKEGWFW